MPLRVGERLGPYDVVASLGAGGMGEVWRARDSRLGRDVAINVLPGDFAADRDRSIVHRDLKPENVFLTADGAVKVLDLGLAKLIDPVAPDQADTVSRLQTGATEAGRVLGTMGYMAPEQVRGQPVDQRADIFAIDVVLYEMVSGRNPFLRTASVETFSAVVVPPLDRAPRREAGASVA